MKMKRVLIIAALLAAVVVNAQDYKFGDVSMEELQEEKYSKDPDANACILYEHRETYIVITSAVELITEMYQKVKVYNTDGADAATVQVYLFKRGTSGESIRSIKAVTHNLENGKDVEYKLDKSQIFTTDVTDYLKEVKFTLPNVKPGSVLEIEYTLANPTYWNFDDVVFQHDYPVKKFYAEIRTPEIYHYNRTMKGFTSIDIKRELKMDHRLGSNVEIYRYTQNDIPALKEEPFVDNMNNYRGAVMYELSYIQTPTKLTTFSQTWDDVAKQIGNEDDYMEDLDKARFVNEIVDPIVAGKTSAIEKMQALFDHVKKEYTWNEMEGKFFYNGLKKTIKEKKGNSADINLLLVAMLRYAGIDANPVVISTKDNMIPLFPTYDRLNYVIAHTRIGDDEYLMDATREFSEINILPVNDYNWEGMYINNNQMKWKKIGLRQPDQSFKSVDVLCTLSEDGSAEGKMRYTYDKHDAMDFKTRYKDAIQEDFIKAKENALNGVEISDYKAINTEAGTKRPTESFSFFTEEASESIGGKLYVKPLLFLTRTESPFVSETRECPIDFGYPFETKYNVIVTIPQGYKVEFAPESKLLQLPDNLGEVKYLINVTASGLQVSYDFKINRAMIGPTMYRDMKDFFSKMVEIESEKIILSKA